MSAHLIRECHRQVNAFVFELSAETSINFRHNVVTLRITGRATPVCSSRNVSHIAVLIRYVFIPSGISSLIHSSVFTYVKLIHRFAFTINIATTDPFAIQIRMQFQYLILQEGGIDIGTPAKILTVNNDTIHVNFKPIVAYGTNVHWNTGVTHGRRYRFIIQHVIRLTVEVFNRTI